MLFVHPSVPIRTHPYTVLGVCPSIRAHPYPSVYCPRCLSIHPCPSVPIRTHPYTVLGVCPSVRACPYPSVYCPRCLSIRPCLSLPIRTHPYTVLGQRWLQSPQKLTWGPPIKVSFPLFWVAARRKSVKIAAIQKEN